MDKFDRKILAYLQRDGRASYQDIGESVGLSLSACHKRAKALEASGVIERYAAIIDEEQAGFATSAYVQVALKDQKQETLDAFETEVVRHDQVMECVLMSGGSDYLLRILCDGVKGYEHLHRDFLTSLPGVERVTSSFALRTVCRRTEVPLRPSNVVTAR